MSTNVESAHIGSSRTLYHLYRHHLRTTQVTTKGQVSPTGLMSYIQELQVGLMDIAKPRLVYVPYNHTAMFIDGNNSAICDQGFHWASPGIEICGPWAQHEQQFAYSVNARTLDNMQIDIEVECWVQMVNPERSAPIPRYSTTCSRH
jgi:hypothetical protein